MMVRKIQFNNWLSVILQDSARGGHCEWDVSISGRGQRHQDLVFLQVPLVGAASERRHPGLGSRRPPARPGKQEGPGHIQLQRHRGHLRSQRLPRRVRHPVKGTTMHCS